MADLLRLKTARAGRLQSLTKRILKSKQAMTDGAAVTANDPNEEEKHPGADLRAAVESMSIQENASQSQSSSRE